MKKKYEAATLEILALQQSDVITSSALLSEDLENDGLEFDFGVM